MAKTTKTTPDRQIELRQIDALIPYARNARTHTPDQVAQIAASIREFGWTNPVLIDDENGIVAGHARVLAAQKLGQAQVPCVVLSGLTKAQRKAYILADNKLALNAGWDNDHYQHEPILFAWKKTHKRNKAGTMQTSVWEVDKPRASPDHATQKPIALPVNAILNHTDPKDVVLDPFCGSGTTLIASEQLNRKCRAIDIEPRYVDVTITRWQNFTGKQAILDGDGRTFDEIKQQRLPEGK